jgi:Zn-finger nucleic acid-binding protein
MKCPTCKEPKLVISERQGIEIDYCPECRGVWLDRGELDKILERSQQATAPASTPQANPQPQQAPYQQQSHQQGPYAQGSYPKPYKRKKSFLEELFD